MIITIDGPAASGKSTVAQAIAQSLHIYYLSSGMLYRALSSCLLHHLDITLEQLKDCDIQIDSHCLNALHYNYDVQTGVLKIIVDGKDITPCLKEPFIDKAASLVGENKNARIFLLDIQRKLANKHDLVAEGRDAGSVVFPNATIKFYLTASVEVRARRWLNDQIKLGNTTLTMEKALHIIMERDERDMNRPHAPLAVYPDNIIIDNSALDLDQTLALMLSIITKVIKK